jgi:hypothetical protein
MYLCMTSVCSSEVGLASGLCCLHHPGVLLTKSHSVRLQCCDLRLPRMDKQGCGSCQPLEQSRCQGRPQLIPPMQLKVTTNQCILEEREGGRGGSHLILGLLAG